MSALAIAPGHGALGLAAAVSGDHPQAAALRRLLRGLSGDGHEVRVAGPAAALPEAGLLILAGRRAISPGLVDHVSGWLRSGGRLLTLGGGTLAALAPHLEALQGWDPGGLSTPAELVVRVVPGRPAMARLDEEMTFRESVPLAVSPPPGADSILVTTWHFRDRPVAFSLDHGAGRLVHLGLGESSRTVADPLFARLLRRGAALAAGLEPAPAVKVGLLGYGAIGREHGDAVSEVEGLRLVAVCDSSAQRREMARERFEVRAHTDLDGLLSDPEVELVVVGTPPNLHARSSVRALEAGRHVVSDKPMALTTAEADAMLQAAASAGRVLTVYQNRRWDPDFTVLLREVRAGHVGEPFYMESFIGGHSHPCQYWHSHEPVSGGTIYDWGSHYFDWMLRLLPGRVVRVEAQAHKRVWHDVTNSDQVRVDLTFQGGVQGQFLQSDIAAVLKPKWYLLGTEGALLGEWRHEKVSHRAWGGDLVEESLAPADSPARMSLHLPGPGGGDRRDLALPARPRNAFYRNLADHLLLGEPLAVKPHEAGRTVAVMEAATRSMVGGGRALRVSI